MLVWASYTFVALIDSLCFWDPDSISDEKYITMKAIGLLVLVHVQLVIEDFQIIFI